MAYKKIIMIYFVVYFVFFLREKRL